MSLDHPAVFVGILTGVIGAFSALNSLVVGWVERRRQRRERAVNLYNEYYSADNYRRIVLPVICLHLKWHALPEGERTAYRATVRRGWLGFDNAPERLLEAYVGPEKLHDDPDTAHFRNTVSAEAFTEHESLTVFLYFWTKVYELLKSRVIDHETTARLLKRPYGYVARFLKELREDVERHAGSEALPVWVEATRHLDEILC
jgi:hypothetical protein